MSRWPATKARRVLAALRQVGWSVKRQSGGSHKVLERVGWSDVVFAFHEDEEVGPRMLARIAKHTGLQPDDLGSLPEVLDLSTNSVGILIPLLNEGTDGFRPTRGLVLGPDEIQVLATPDYDATVEE